ncbi:hypothetical protein [Actinokineospora globicatena]|uniref:DNA-binding protein n=1 Tax=Actinokineospora globicatena TaxID=103729 RepID=A0A9W6V609_9PSEU|nr:hypothetical protein [Actinokineospora globicatena]GLW91025.1 hypothetical protein Aglo03_18410 [Actinokineospora globicatena]
MSAELLAVGAVLPGSSEGEDRDVLLARHYEHPALEDRVVVRLVPEVLGVAEDLTAEYLGFTAPSSAEPVGVAKRSALGFPAWALINDPANAGHALALVKDIERLDRVAKSKAGAAKDGFAELATMLGGSAPHFLPTFYEEAARIFLRHGNTSFAATMFGKAREAEQVHDLAVDAERIRAVFLEFAFAGALPAKALTGYAKDLARRYSAEEAYERFRTLCVERVRAGLPPHAGMPEDLRRLAKAAKLDLRVEDERVLREVVQAASVARAAAGFWKSYRDALVALAKNDPAVRARFLAFVPQQKSTLDLWLGVLTECGATAALTGPPDPTVATTPAAWLATVAASRSAGWGLVPRSPALLALAETMVDRLVADGESVRLAGRWREVELDLIDLLLTNGVPVDSTAEWIDLSDWLADDTPGRRDLSAIAASPRGTALGEAITSCLYSESGEDDIAKPDTVRQVLAVPGLRHAFRDWITSRTSDLGQTVPGLTEDLAELGLLRVADAFVDVPEAAEAVAGVDVADAVVRTLRAGLFDELGWPALDEAIAGFGGKSTEVGVRGEGWPALVVGRAESFAVVGPDGVLAQHTASIPAAQRHQWYDATAASWHDGVLLVIWYGPSSQVAYWSNDPARHITLRGFDLYDLFAARASVALPDGGRFTGKRVIHPGDTVIPQPTHAYSDGTAVWSADQYREDGRWLQVDPATGTTARSAPPAFLDEFAVDGARLDLDRSDLRPATPATEASPLGAAGGLHGWRVREEADGTWTGEGIDGRRVTAALPVRGLLDLPGTRLTISEDTSGTALLDAEGRIVATLRFGEHYPTYAAGTPAVVPLPWWHLLRPRDEAGSAALRAVTKDAVESMLAAGVAALEAAEWDGDLKDWDDDDVNLASYTALKRGERDALATAVQEALPGVTHLGLLAGVVSVIRRAAGLVIFRRGFDGIAAAAKALSAGQADTGTRITENEVSVALDWFRRNRSDAAGTSRTPLPDLIAALGALAEKPVQVDEGLPELASVEWVDFAPHLGALALRAASPVTPESERDTLVAVLCWIADSGILDRPGQWRRVVATIPEKQTAHRHRVHPTSDGFVAVSYTSWFGPGGTATGLQFSRGGFALPEGWAVDQAEDFGPVDSGWITRFLDLLAERGPYPWRPEAAATLVERTGLGTAEATYLLAGMPGVFRWGASFISTEDRAVLGLSLPGAKAARERMRDLDDRFRRSLFAAGAPADPGDLWTTGPDAAAVAEVWTAKFGARRPVDDDLLADATTRLPYQRSAEEVTSMLNPAATAWLHTDAEMKVADGRLESRTPGGFTDSHLLTVPRVLAWLSQRLPAGSPHRAALTETLALARQRVAHPGFGLDLGWWLSANEVRGLIGAEAPTEVGTVRVRDWLDVHYDGEDYSLIVWPGLLGPHDRDMLVAAMELAHSGYIEVLDLLASDGLTAACGATLPDPTVYFQDPTVSVPHLVAEVAATHNIDEDAAALYLQLLALPDPTDANVARWTGWKPARLRKTRAALGETDLVLTAKRARAGRTLFLPGAWLALSTPHLPLEAWKASMYGFTENPPLVITALEPIADLFTRAWTRTREGDAPAYEDLATARSR